MPKQKLLLGCSGEGLARRASIPEIFALLREAGFQSVDFWLYLYSLEPDQPMLQSGKSRPARGARIEIAGCGSINGSPPSRPARGARIEI